MFRAPLCSSSGESIVFIWHLVCDFPDDDQENQLSLYDIWYIWYVISLMMIRRINCLYMTSGMWFPWWWSGESIVFIWHLVCDFPDDDQENQLSLYDIWYVISLMMIRRISCLYMTSGIWFSWWWAHECSKYAENWNKHIRETNCASSWLFTRIEPRCTVKRTWTEKVTFVCPSVSTFTGAYVSKRFITYTHSRFVITKGKGKGESKLHPRTGHEDPERE